MTTSEDLRPSTTETALEVECSQMQVALKPSGPAGDGMRARRSGACLCQPFGDGPIILYREDLSVEQRAKHVRYLLARLREPWGGALLLQDPALLLDSPEYR